MYIDSVGYPPDVGGVRLQMLIKNDARLGISKIWMVILEHMETRKFLKTQVIINKGNSFIEKFSRKSREPMNIGRGA